ncbi:hypothetical protein NF27_JN00070 [Candidatus Jidaibacter acanthamoeba]|uniref:Uncharacterized protein n=1 Tax=Candidatus Jidaibacter acanthamoebae TaxID=86105 RepID=A0A0C1MW51_9RICK|nr:hypothetical protein NF27_JN00070 [Candidatus Jidaibacter acanthamoeba]
MRVFEETNQKLAKINPNNMVCGSIPKLIKPE